MLRQMFFIYTRAIVTIFLGFSCLSFAKENVVDCSGFLVGNAAFYHRQMLRPNGGSHICSVVCGINAFQRLLPNSRPQTEADFLALEDQMIQLARKTDPESNLSSGFSLDSVALAIGQMFATRGLQIQASGEYTTSDGFGSNLPFFKTVTKLNLEDLLRDGTLGIMAISPAKDRNRTHAYNFDVRGRKLFLRDPITPAREFEVSAETDQNGDVIVGSKRQVVDGFVKLTLVQKGQPSLIMP
ncbi:MAG: hypothetical protein ACXVA9_02295 [Bdellovibrionales bacterium]